MSKSAFQAKSLAPMLMGTMTSCKMQHAEKNLSPGANDFFNFNFDKNVKFSILVFQLVQLFRLKNLDHVSPSMFWFYEGDLLPLFQQFVLFMKMGHPRPLSHLFLVFSNKHYNFYSNICEKCPSSIQCWDLNPQPLGRESPPINTRSGVPPSRSTVCCYFEGLND